MKFKAENNLIASFNFTSLTDVVMLLLVFFLLSSSFVTQLGIKVQLPKAATAESSSDRNIIVTLTEKGQVFLNAEHVMLGNLGPRIARSLQSSQDKVIVIRADKGVTLQNTVQVIDIAKAAGASRFMIATLPPPAQ